jgi:DNA-binding NarL/FixJ family response regulator
MQGPERHNRRLWQQPRHQNGVGLVPAHIARARVADDRGPRSCSAAPARIVIVIDGHLLYRDALARGLALQRDFQVEGNYASAAEVPELSRNTPVDVVLLDLPLEAEAVLAGRARTAGFRGSVVAITGEITARDAKALLDAGCASVFLKSRRLSELCEVIRNAAAAGRSPREALQKADRVPIEDRLQAARDLTPRELEVLIDVFRGLSNKEIAADLGISANTVKTFLQQLFQKTGARSRTQLVRTAMEGYWDGIESGEAGSEAMIASTGL